MHDVFAANIGFPLGIAETENIAGYIDPVNVALIYIEIVPVYTVHTYARATIFTLQVGI